MFYFEVFYVLLGVLLSGTESARILGVFPTPSISHQVVFRAITQQLARRGHQVTVITTDPVFPKGEAPENFTEIDVHDISYKEWEAKFIPTATGKKDGVMTTLEVAFELMTDVIEKQLKNDEVQDMIYHKTFDLLIIEAWARPALLYTHLFKSPVILVSSLGAMPGNYDIVGGMTHPVMYPMALLTKAVNHSTWEKIQEFNLYAQIQKFYYEHEDVENAMVSRNLGPDVPKLSELSNNVDMLFLNMHKVWEGNYPVPPTVIHMGGLHQIHKPQKKMPQDLKKFFDESKHGVIFMSFGTNTNPSSLPPERIQTFVRVFSKLPYDILWKWDKDELPGRTKNIRIGKWFPQSDLLRHPKLKLFITQGGLQSTDEAITAGVPLIGIPMLGDQWFNVEKYQHHKIGVRLHIDTITEHNLNDAIKLVIHDESFRENIAKLRTIIEDQPMKPLERVIWWTEYVIRHKGAKHLRSPAANLSLISYYELPLVTGLLVTFIVLILLFIFVLRFMYRNCFVLVTCNKIKNE